MLDKFYSVEASLNVLSLRLKEWNNKTFEANSINKIVKENYFEIYYFKYSHEDTFLYNKSIIW